MLGRHYKKRAEREAEEAVEEAQYMGEVETEQEKDERSEEIIKEEWLRQRAIPTDESLAAELAKFVHDHSNTEVPPKVKEAGGVFVSKQMAFSNLTKEEAEQFKCDGTALRYMMFNDLDPESDLDPEMINLAQLEGMINVQITKGRDFTERKASVSQLIGTFQRALPERRKGGVLDSLRSRIGR